MDASIEKGLICPNYRFFIDNSDNMVHIINTRFHFITFNSSYSREVMALSDYLEKEGEAVFNRQFPHGFLQIEKSVYQRAFRGETFDYETQLKTDSGSSAYRHRLFPFYTHEGVIAGATVFTKKMMELDEDVSPQTEKYITQLKQIEQEILVERDRFKSVLDCSPDGVYIVDKDFNIEYVNPAIEKEFGPVAGQKCYTYFHGNTGKCEWCKNDEVHQGKTVRWEWYSHKNKKWYDLVDLPLKNADGSISKFEIFHDITDRKKAEQALKESEEKFRLAFDNANIGMCLVATDGRILKANTKMAEIFGYSREEIETMTVNAVSYPEDVSLSPRFMQDAVKGKTESASFEKRYFHKNGSIIYGKVYSSLVKDTEGKPLYFISAIQDITIQKKNEILMSQQDELIKMTGQMAKIGGWEFDAVTFQGTWTDEVARIHDLEPGAETNVEIGLNFYTPDSRKKIEDAINHAIQNAMPYDLELELITEKNVHKWVRTVGTPIVENDKVIKVRGYFRDITEKKNAELEREKLIIQLENALESERASHEEMEAAYEEMEATQQELEAMNKKLENALYDSQEANRLKQELLALMSHEIRTPLSGIIGFTELTLSEITQNSCSQKCKDLQSNIGFVYKSGLRLNDLLTNLLELSAGLSGKEIKIQNEFFNMEELLKDIIILFEKRIMGNNNIINYRILCDSLIYSDPLKLQQILFNLIGNALKFTKNGEINVIIDRQGKEYVFSVKDTGIGIAKKDHEVIFDTFKQIDSCVNTRKYQGVGIGLSVCKKLINALNGTITLESELEKGSHFTFTIPIPAEISVSHGAVSAPVHIEMGNDLKILFAEDDEINFEYLKQLVKTLTPAKSRGFIFGKPLIEEFKKDRDYNLILLDIQMPGMNGVECLNEIRKLNKHVNVIALTSYAMQADRDKFLALGFDEYISKPIDRSQLLTKIKGLLK